MVTRTELLRQRTPLTARLQREVQQQDQTRLKVERQLEITRMQEIQIQKQQEIESAARKLAITGINRLLRGRSLGFSKEMTPEEKGALEIIRAWEKTPEAKYAYRRASEYHMPSGQILFPFQTQLKPKGLGYYGTQALAEQGYSPEAIKELQRATQKGYTGAFITPSGEAMTISPERIAEAGMYVGPGEISTYQLREVPKEIAGISRQVTTTPFEMYTSQAQREFFETVAPRMAVIKTEVQRYKDIGYTPSQARTLAAESLERGGMTFTPEEAARVVMKEEGKLFQERVLTPLGTGALAIVGKVADVVSPVLEKEPLLEKYYDKPITYGEMLAAPAKGAEWIIERTGKGWGEIYGTTIEKLPKEYQPKIDEKYITPGMIEKGVETVGMGRYFIPSVGTGLIASEVAVGIEEYKKYEKEADKILKESYAKYEGDLTAEEFKAEVYPSIVEDVRRAALIRTGVSIGILGGIGALKGYRAVTKPIIRIKEPLPKPSPTIGEVQVPLEIGGKEIKIGTYEIVQKYPEVTYKITSPAREFFGMKPSKLITTKPKVKVTFVHPELPAIEGLPVTAFETRKILPGTWQRFKEGRLGRGLSVNIYTLRGKEIPTSLSKFSQLGREEQYLWQQLVQKHITQGRTVPLKEVPKYIRKDYQKLRGIIESEELGALPGRRLRVAEVGTILKGLPPPVGARQAFKSITGFKDITYPFSRAAGEIPTIRGLTVVTKPIKIDPRFKLDLSKLDILKTETGLRVPKITPDIIKQAQKVLRMKKVKPGILLPPPKISKYVKPSLKPKEVVEIPTMVGGTGLVTIPWAGKGVYERTVVGGLLPEVTKVSDVSAVELKPISRLGEIQKFVMMPKERIGLRERQELRLKERLMLRERQELKEKQRLRERLREKQALKQRLGLRERLMVREKLMLRGQIAPMMKPSTKPVLKIPRPPLIIPIIDQLKKPTKYPKKKKEKELFLPYIRRRGEFFAIGKPTGIEKAKKVGIEELRRTLAASLQIRKLTGERVKFVKETPEFRLGKKEAVTLIQRAPRRLKAREEVAEIIAARRAGGAQFFR